MKRIDEGRPAVDRTGEVLANLGVEELRDPVGAATRAALGRLGLASRVIERAINEGRDLTAGEVQAVDRAMDTAEVVFQLYGRPDPKGVYREPLGTIHARGGGRRAGVV